MNRPHMTPRTRLPAPRFRPPEPVEVAGLVATLRGRDLILINEDGEHDGWVAWQDEFDTIDGWPHVRFVSRQDWNRYEVTGRPPARILHWPVAAAWLRDGSAL
jgi:hypothetical protein